MNHRLFTYRWVGHWCYGKCTCGWEGLPSGTTTGAKALHKAHMVDDCPIGKRTTGS